MSNQPYILLQPSASSSLVSLLVSHSLRFDNVKLSIFMIKFVFLIHIYVQVYVCQSLFQSLFQSIFQSLNIILSQN